MLNEQGFDLWADGYDRSVGLSDEGNTYPFAGYKRVLNAIYNAVLANGCQTVLDIGFGTGTLTQKLYDEGLEKGRAEADKLVADAKAEARKIVAEARAEAEEIVKKAEAKAEDVSKNTMTEISLAGKQAVGRIKSEIASLIIAKATARGVKEAVVDPAFIKEMLVAVAKNWNGSDSGKVELQALLPEGERKKLDAAFEESAKELLAAGVEVGWSKEVKTGFKVGAKEGGYYISFADADIEALLAEYLRDKVFQLLFKA